IGSSQIQQIDAPPPRNPQPQVYHYDIPFTVPADATLATLQVVWPEGGGNQSVAIVIPDGPTIPQSEFPPANGFSGLPPPPSRQAIAVGAVTPDGPSVAPPPGTSPLRLISNRQFSTAPKLTASYGYARPTIAVGELPPFPGGNTVTVPASGRVTTALGSNARATLFYASDSAGYRGTPIAGARGLPGCGG